MTAGRLTVITYKMITCPQAHTSPRHHPHPLAGARTALPACCGPRAFALRGGGRRTRRRCEASARSGRKASRPGFRLNGVGPFGLVPATCAGRLVRTEEALASPLTTAVPRGRPVPEGGRGCARPPVPVGCPVQLVRPRPPGGTRRKREPGGNPGLPRSGEWERTPSYALGPDGSGKRRPVGGRLVGGGRARESEDLPVARTRSLACGDPGDLVGGSAYISSGTHGASPA